MTPARTNKWNITMDDRMITIPLTAIPKGRIFFIVS
jgi:hypothetical protein